MTDRMRHLPCGQAVNSNIEFAILPPDARFYLTRSDTKRYNYKAVYSYSKTDL